MKFKSSDERYLERRREFSKEAGARELWSVVDHWPLYCGIKNLARFMAIADLLRSKLDVPGHVAEFGSWRGATLMLMAKLLRIYDPHGSKQVHCFDSFSGLQTFNEKDGVGASAQGAYRGDYEELVSLIHLYELEDEIIIHKGNILETLPALLDADQAVSFSFVYCDTDLFEPTQKILECIHPRLMKGGLFVVDEWNYEQWPGETAAVRAFLDRYGDAYQPRHVSTAAQPSLVLEKVR